jgi:hypothetical protein
MRDAMKFYRDFMATAPDEVNAFFAVLIVPSGAPFDPAYHNKTVCGVVICHVGDPAHGESLIKPLRQFGPPLMDLVGPMPFPVVQSMFDPLLPPGLQHYWKADFVHQLSDAAIDEHVTYGPRVPSVSSVVHVYPVDGAAGRVPMDATAFSYRDARFVHVIAAMYPDPNDTPANVKWVRDYWNALHPHSAEGSYVNFMMDETDARIRATYRGNFDRLAALKKKYDPLNVFRLNQNIAPAP